MGEVETRGIGVSAHTDQMVCLADMWVIACHLYISQDVIHA